jgi:ribonucleoside-diphosphate reductase alpha chain
VLEALATGRPATRLPGLSARERALLRTGAELDWRAQLAFQAVVQAHVDGAVSKTLQLPAHATRATVLEAIGRAQRSGCKGLACYRSARVPVCIDCRGVS